MPRPTPSAFQRACASLESALEIVPGGLIVTDYDETDRARGVPLGVLVDALAQTELESETLDVDDRARVRAQALCRTAARVLAPLLASHRERLALPERRTGDVLTLRDAWWALGHCSR